MNKTALLVVDMVYDFTNPSGKVYYPINSKIIPDINRLIKASRKHNCLIIFMQHRYRKDKYDANLNEMRPCCLEGSGGEVLDSRLDFDEKKDYLIQKRRYSSFYGTDLDLVLREHKIENLMVVGTKTNCCINATVLDAHYRSYNTYVIRECVGTNDELTNEIYLRDMNKYLCRVIGLDEALRKLEDGEL
ncbi:MAG TPA: isochorismatase family cysteine hydrolase [Bacilli bacterium]